MKSKLFSSTDKIISLFYTVVAAAMKRHLFCYFKSTSYTELNDMVLLFFEPAFADYSSDEDLDNKWTRKRRRPCVNLTSQQTAVLNELRHFDISQLRYSAI
jgi:hypothetical protein